MNNLLEENLSLKSELLNLKNELIRIKSIGNNITNRKFMNLCKNGLLTEEKLNLYLEYNGDINYKNTVKWSGLMLACSNGHLNVVKLLLKYNIDINYETNNESSAFLLACLRNYSNIVQLLLDNNVIINTNSLINNIVYFSYDIISFLLEKQIISFNNQDEFGNNILILFICSNYFNEKIIKLLLKSNFDINYQNKDGWTALHFAFLYEDKEMIEILLQNGANSKIKNNKNENYLNMKSANGNNIEDFLNKNKIDI